MKGFIYFLRFFLIGLAIFLSFRPTYKLHSKSGKPKLAIVIDNSRSMRYGNKFSNARGFIYYKCPEIEKYFDPVIFTLTKKLGKGELWKIAPSLNKTDFVPIMERIAETEGIKNLLLLSDGFNTSSGDIRSSIQKLEVNVLPVIFENWKDISDISVESVDTPEIAFKNVRCEISVKILASGIRKGKISVYLKKGNEILDRKRVEITDRSNKFTVKMHFTPQILGRQKYSVEVPPHYREVNRKNNKLDFWLYVKKEKIRVLFICGRPGPEYRFLRYLIKSNPSMELVSLIILRNPEDIAIAPDHELSLIPFPTERIFVRELFNFDVLIFENFTYTKFRITRNFLENIEKFVVEHGKGFIMIGGDSSFGKGYYKNTPIENILPVKLEHPYDNINKGLFKPVLVEPLHPILRIGKNLTHTRRIWKELPPLENSNRIRIREGSMVLLKRGETPILAIWEKGKGRVVSVGTNTTWRWALCFKDGTYYRKFWENVIFWSARALPEKDYEIFFDKPKYAVGEEVFFRIIPLLENIGSPNVKVISPNGDVERALIQKIGRSYNGKFVATISGVYTLSLSPGYTYWVDVVGGGIEDAGVSIDSHFLEELAFFSGGKVFYADEFSGKKLWNELKPLLSTGSVIEVNIWNSKLFFFLLICLLFIEWVIRKIKGLP